jgi:hypothetical protein
MSGGVEGMTPELLPISALEPPIRPPDSWYTSHAVRLTGPLGATGYAGGGMTGMAAIPPDSPPRGRSVLSTSFAAHLSSTTIN